MSGVVIIGRRAGRMLRAPLAAGLLVATLLAPSPTVGAAPPSQPPTPPPIAAVGTPSQDPRFFSTTGYRVEDGAIWTYFQQHGGVHGLGFPISNAFQLLGSRVQLFQRTAIQVRPDGSVGPINLVDGSYLPLPRLGGASASPGTDPLAQLGSLPATDYYQRLAAYLDAAAPAEWNGQPVNFGAAYRASVRCQDDLGLTTCDERVALALATELWGLPTGRPIADPRNANYVYLWFQRGVLVYSRAAGDTQWLLLGELFKRVLHGDDLPADMLAQVSASPSQARLYAQYDPLAPNGVARPAELPATSLAGAFLRQTPSPNAAAAPVQSAAPPSADATASPATAPAPSATLRTLDPRFGVAEGFRAPAVMAEVGAGWERLVVPWDQVQPDGPSDFSHLGLTLSADRLRADRARGVRVAGVLQFTPDWAQANPAAGQRSVPKNLDRPFNDPTNYWGRFVYETVKHYAGQIDEWVIWNEPDIGPGDPGGGASAWAGSDEEFAQLLKVGYLAAKKANPNASVSFPATSYWVDELSRPKRSLFYERLLSMLSRDPRAAEHNFYHDAVALNLYRSPDDVYRVHEIFAAIQRAYDVDKPLWLTEMNAMPTDDAQSVCSARDTSSAIKTTLDQQAAYVIQTYALAAAAGYQRTEFYKMIDADGCQEPPWGLVRSDGSRRPVAEAARTAIAYFSSFITARFAPLTRQQEAWPAWPANPSSYLPNWQIYQVAFDRPGNQRVTVLWNGDGVAERVRIPRNGSSARLVDRHGADRPLQEDAGAWVVDLPAATAHFRLDDQNGDPDGYHVIGGEPLLLVEEAVDPSAPVVPARLVGP